MHKTSVLPEPDKWIRLYCCDWSPYRVIGKRVNYKTSGWRFMSRDESGLLNSDHKCWKDCETWEYCNEGDKP